MYNEIIILPTNGNKEVIQVKKPNVSSKY